jgi:hypothetical protein
LSTLSGGTGLEAAATAAAAYCCWNSDELLKELLAEHSAWVAELQLVKEELQLACLLLVSGKDMLSSSMRVSPSLSTVSLMVQQPLETLSRELTEGGSSGLTISKREECFRLERVCCWRLKCFCAWLWCGTRIQECQREKSIQHQRRTTRETECGAHSNLRGQPGGNEVLRYFAPAASAELLHALQEGAVLVLAPGL